MGEAKKDRNYKRKLEELVQKDELLRHVRWVYLFFGSCSCWLTASKES